MKQCIKCFYTDNHPLGITFNSEGVCSGCQIHEEKDTLNWNDRWDKLKNLVEQFKNKTDRNYDCVVPVSGGRDSFFILEVVVKRLGLNPLLVTYNPHYMTKLGHENLIQLRGEFDKDLLTHVVDPEITKRITKVTLEKMGSMYWHVLAGQTVFPVQIAVAYRIPLIIWGANQGCDQVGMFSHTHEVEMTRRYRREHDLMGYEAEKLTHFGLSLSDLNPYIYPEDSEIEAIGVRGVYLNNYIRWDSMQQHLDMQKKYGYLNADQKRTYDSFNDAESCYYNGIHDLIKYLKHGYSKITDHVNRDIRLKHITKEEGEKLINFYTYNFPEDISKFCDWIGLKEDEIWSLIKPNCAFIPPGVESFKDLRSLFKERSVSSKTLEKEILKPAGVYGHIDGLNENIMLTRGIKLQKNQ